MSRFRKKPVEVDAVQWTGKNHAEIFELMSGSAPAIEHAPESWAHRCAEVDRLGLTIPTLEGNMTANQGDWIIRGTKGEIYPCKPDIFAEIYEPVE
jgi:hypothetical protein